MRTRFLLGGVAVAAGEATTSPLSRSSSTPTKKSSSQAPSSKFLQSLGLCSIKRVTNELGEYVVGASLCRHIHIPWIAGDMGRVALGSSKRLATPTYTPIVAHSVVLIATFNADGAT